MSGMENMTATWKILVDGYEIAEGFEGETTYDTPISQLVDGVS